jgi:TAP-like protein
LVALVAGVLAGVLPGTVHAEAASANGTSATGTPAASPRVPVLDWRPCYHGFQCATARVPLNYRQPRGAAISIAMSRHLATGPGRPAGSLFFNPGGPGGPGAEALTVFWSLFPAAVRARFDTGDPVTPYRGAVAMSHLLARARLLTVDGFGHTEFLNPSTCAQNYESSYLLTGTLPPAGTACPQNGIPFPS